MESTFMNEAAQGKMALERTSLENGSRTYEFDLFISYTAKDESEFRVDGTRVRPIRTLKRALEQHFISDGRQRRRFKVCTDTEDFEPSATEPTIDGAIHKCLSASRALLVVCSSHSAASRYVGDPSVFDLCGRQAASRRNVGP